MKQPFPLEAVPTAELPEGPAAALEPGHRQRGRGTALLCSQHLGRPYRNIFLRPTLATLGLGCFGWGFFGWLFFLPPGFLPSNIIFMHRISGRDGSISWLHYRQRDSVHAWGTRSGDQAWSHTVCCVLFLHTTPQLLPAPSWDWTPMERVGRRVNSVPPVPARRVSKSEGSSG